MTPFAIYQTVHLQGLRPRFVKQHITLLDHLSRTLYGREYAADTEELSRRITKVAAEAGSPEGYSSFVRIELTPDEEVITPAGVSLYDGYVLRYIKPAAATVECDLPLSYAPTTTREAIQQLADVYARARNATTAVCCDSAGRMIMADNAPLFGVRAKELYLGAPLPSVERARLIAMAESLQLHCAEEPLTRQMAEHLDELFYIDHRGVTAFSSCDGNPLISLRAERIAKAMERPFLKK